MGLNNSRAAILSRIITVIVGFVFFLHAHAGYVLVQSLDEVAEGGQFLITSEPSLTSGCMLGNTYNGNDGINGLILSQDIEDSDLIEWTITPKDISVNNITCEVSLTNKKLGLADNLEDLTFSTRGSNTSWVLSTFTENGISAFQLKNAKNTSRRLCLLDTGYTIWKAYSSSSTPYFYLFKRTDLEAPQILAENSRFAEQLEISLDAEEGCDIYYTLDGTAPTTASTLYSTPFTISGSTTVKAIAVRDEETSAIAERTFTYCSPITVNLGGNEHLGTLYSSYPVMLPENAKAYVITGKDDEAGTLTLTNYTPTHNVLPDSVPFILQNEGMASLTLPFTTEQAGERPSYAKSLVMGTTERIAKPENMQILALGLANDGVTLGFFPYKSDMLAANRAYLTLPVTSEYVWVNSVDEYVSGAEYIFTSGCENGKPAGYYAGEYKDGALIPHPFVDGKEPYLWTLTGEASTFTIEDERGNNLSIASGGRDLEINKNNDKWKFYTYNNKKLLIRTVTNFGNYNLSFNHSDSPTLFKNYSYNYGPFYLFRKVTPVATSQGYSFRFDDKAVGIKQATTKPTHDSIYYDLQGRQTTNPSRGIWIINGEKVYINR